MKTGTLASIVGEYSVPFRLRRCIELRRCARCSVPSGLVIAAQAPIVPLHSREEVDALER